MAFLVPNEGEDFGLEKIVNHVVLKKPISEIYKDIYKGKKFTSFQGERPVAETGVSYHDLFLRGGNE